MEGLGARGADLGKTSSLAELPCATTQLCSVGRRSGQKRAQRMLKPKTQKMRKPGWEPEIDMETTASSTVTQANQPFGGAGGLLKGQWPHSVSSETSAT